MMTMMMISVVKIILKEENINSKLKFLNGFIKEKLIKFISLSLLKIK